MLGYAGLRAAKLAKDLHAKLLAAGITSLILCQATLNFFAVLGMAPLTGVPLPVPLVRKHQPDRADGGDGPTPQRGGHRRQGAQGQPSHASRRSKGDAMPRIVIAAGGTAGHVVPALAIADSLRARGAEVEFIGGERAEAELVPAAGYPFHQLRVRGLDRRRPLRAALALVLAAVATLRAIRLLRRLGADAVLGGGGYVAGPVGLAAKLTRRPLLLTEADSHLGVTNRLLAPLAKRVFLAFPLERRRRRKWIVSGRPVPAGTGHADRAAARARFGIGERRARPAGVRRLARRAPAQRRGPRGVRGGLALRGPARQRAARLRRPARIASRSSARRRTTTCTPTSSRSPTRSRPPTWWWRAPAAR